MHENIIPNCHQHFEELNCRVICLWTSLMDTHIHTQTITWWLCLCFTNGPPDPFIQWTALERVFKSARSQGKRTLGPQVTLEDWSKAFAWSFCKSVEETFAMSKEEVSTNVAGTTLAYPAVVKKKGSKIFPESWLALVTRKRWRTPGD